MKGGAIGRVAPRRSSPARTAALLAALLFLGGCATSTPPAEPRPAHAAGRTLLRARTAVPAAVTGHFFLVEIFCDKRGPYTFLVDTGAAISVVSPRVARLQALPPGPRVRVRAADGATAELRRTTIGQLRLGDARFERVPALVHDFSELSGHLGRPIDGVLGFPLFHECLLTLDYPRRLLRLTPPGGAASQRPEPAGEGEELAFNNERGTPFVTLSLGGRRFDALLDSGSDALLTLNPVGLNPRFSQEPRPGPLVTTVAGDYRSVTGRLAEALTVGPYVVEEPIAEVTDGLSSLGGAFLRHFAVTFDSRGNRARLERETRAPLTVPPRRSTGLSFSRQGAYWRVDGVVPHTPAASLPVRVGDLCVRIGGRLAGEWTLERYEEALRTEKSLLLTLLRAGREIEVTAPIFDLVP